MNDPRRIQLAKVLVNYSTNVKKGDVVRLRMPVVAEPLLLAVYREVLRAGGHPFVRMAPEECTELMARYGKPFQLDYLYPLDVEEYKDIAVDISAWAYRNTRLMTGVSAKAQAALSKARRPLLDVALSRIAATGRRKLRWVGTLHPTHASAQDADMSLAEYEDFVYRGGMLDQANPIATWKRISTAQQRLADFLDKAEEVRFVAPGTDIRFGVKGRRWINCDGKNNFPDGEVFTGPIETATEGEVRFSYPAVYQGREVSDVFLKFKSGRVVDADASKNRDFLYEMMDQDKGGRTLGELAVGTNYAIKRFTRNTLFDEKIGGTVHVALGASLPPSGGKNKSALHWDIVCDLRKTGRIEVDGQPIAKNGRFLRARWPQPPGRS